MSSTFMRRSLIEEEEEHGSDDSGVDSGSDSDDVPILAPRRVVRNPDTLDAGKPYLQQKPNTQLDTRRTMEVRASPNLDEPDDPSDRAPRFCPSSSYIFARTRDAASPLTAPVPSRRPCSTARRARPSSSPARTTPRSSRRTRFNCSRISYSAPQCANSSPPSWGRFVGKYTTAARARVTTRRRANRHARCS